MLSGAQRADSGENVVDGKGGHCKSDRGDRAGIIVPRLNNFMHLDVATTYFPTGLPQKHGMINYDQMFAQASGKILDNIGLTHISERVRYEQPEFGSAADVRNRGDRFQKRGYCNHDEPTSAPHGNGNEKLFEIIGDIKSAGYGHLYFAQAGRSIIPCG